ncbi:MAG: hypothetical protein CSA34_02305 [Desulfobulbus propionicus]|nr:MAG: hypothetical protein CSA34_02305 [Desulfobulbus propionicus]
MLRKYLLTALAVALVILLLAFAALPLLFARSCMQGTTFMTMALLWVSLGVAVLTPILVLIVRTVWFFPGSGQPLAKETLMAMLMEVNALDAPVRAVRKRKKLLIGWRFDEPRWSELMHAAGVNQVYELWLDFDEPRRTVTMKDMVRRFRFTPATQKSRQGRISRGRPIFKVTGNLEQGMQFFKETGRFQYTFAPQELKSPVMAMILNNGWNVRFTL